MGKGQSKRNSKEERLIELLFDRLDNSEAVFLFIKVLREIGVLKFEQHSMM